MHAFEYHRPSSSKDALDLAAKKSEGRYLAGGQSLVQAMKLRLSSPSDLIDLGTIRDLAGIKVSGSAVEIGAMTRHADVAGSKDVQKAIPALAALAGIIGDRQVRHMGTIGGSLANNDPAADYPAAVLGLGATITTNKRKIEADKFFKALYETALEAGELITSVSFPVPKRAAYMKFKNPASRFAIVGVFVADFGGKARVGVTGAGPSAFRQAEMEKALSAKFAPDAVASIKVKADGLNNDLHASPEYRAHLITVMAKRAVEAALK
ncbi:MAG: aerobic carbon-monoxide dehydrogenase medium subunit [Betaproteobacteria bacterium]|jgi:carbon-monoxide dehydrogenase medium subunit|nr:aerobic carbon-monoxide dehydrogenase medium subunit [Betaproteobacteria bacterium]